MADQESPAHGVGWAPGPALPSREATLRWVARAVALGTGADEVAVSSVGADGRLTPTHCTGQRAVEAERCQARTGRGPAVRAMRTGQLVNVYDVRARGTDTGVRVRALLGDLRSVTAVPIVYSGRVTAVVDLWWTRPGGPSPADRDTAEHIRRVIAPVLELIEEQDPAYRDPRAGRRTMGWDT